MAQIVRDDYYLYVLRESLEPQARKYANISPIYFSEIPEDVQILKNVNYMEENVSGRSEPWLVYAHTAPTLITFTGRLVAQGEPKGLPFEILPGYSFGSALGLAQRFYGPAAPFLGIGGNVMSFLRNGADFGALFGLERGAQEVVNTILEEVHKPVAEMEAMAHPQYNSQGVAYPPPIVRLRLGHTVDRTGVIRNLSINFRGPWQKDLLLAYRADVFITFQEVNANPKSWSDVRVKRLPAAPPDEQLTLGRVGQGLLDIGRSGMGL